MQIIAITIISMFLFIFLLISKLFVFVGLPWLWVTSPLWLPSAVLTAFLIISGFVELVMKIFKL